MAGVKLVDRFSNNGRSAAVLRHLGQETPGRVSWSVIFSGPALPLVDTAVSNIRTRGLALRLAIGFVAGGAL